MIGRMMHLRHLALVATCLASPCLADGQKRAVIFDVDGTLTPNVYTINLARDDAPAAVQAYADAGVQIIYLTARVPLFQERVADWLLKNGFPPGQLHLTETEADREDHGGFKSRVLETYRADGWSFVAAFGDSSSDFAAYGAAGIPQGRVFALQRLGAWDCKSGAWQGCYKDWVELFPAIQTTLAD